MDSLHKYFTEHNLDHCLKNVPEKLTVVGNTPICGNFFVEEGTSNNVYLVASRLVEAGSSLRY